MMLPSSGMLSIHRKLTLAQVTGTQQIHTVHLCD